MVSEKDCLKVVMFPWLAHGHITPFIELAKALSNKNLHFYICSTPANLTSIKNKIHGKLSLHIHLLELHLPNSPELPPHYHTTNGLPLHLQSTLRKALKKSKPAFSNLLEALQPDLLVHDILLPWAGVVASVIGVRSVSLFTSGATMFSYFVHLGMHRGVEFPFPAIHLSRVELSRVHGYAEDEEEEDDDEKFRRNEGIILVNTSREMEGKYMDYLSKMINKRIVPIGSLVNVGEDGDADDGGIMEWLEGKDVISTVYVSFGSEYFLKKEEIEEIGYGLELSNVNFVWIIRFPKGDGTRVEDVLSKGFLERVGDRGLIVEKWAPQAKILAHSSVAGFVSHCGWNSLKESVDFGVPIIAMPMHLDQPMNAKLVLELGVGVEIKRDEDGRLQRGEISNVIKDVVVGKTGEILRRKVGEQRERIRSRSREEVEGVAKVLVEVCETSQDMSILPLEKTYGVMWH